MAIKGLKQLNIKLGTAEAPDWHEEKSDKIAQRFGFVTKEAVLAEATARGITPAKVEPPKSDVPEKIFSPVGEE